MKSFLGKGVPSKVLLLLSINGFDILLAWLLPGLVNLTGGKFDDEDSMPYMLSVTKELPLIGLEWAVWYCLIGPLDPYIENTIWSA